METKEVPQDKGMYGQWHSICYAVDENGKYVLSKSAGWEPANVANRQAWEPFEHEIAETIEKAKKGELSPLAYHMAKNLMDLGMVSNYTGLARWRVKRHLKPHVFRRLRTAILERYAIVFNTTVSQLRETP